MSVFIHIEIRPNYHNINFRNWARFERETEGISEMVFYSQSTLGKGLFAAIETVSYFSKIDKDDKSAGEESDTSDDDTGEGVDP